MDGNCTAFNVKRIGIINFESYAIEPMQDIVCLNNSIRILVQLCSLRTWHYSSYLNVEIL